MARDALPDRERAGSGRSRPDAPARVLTEAGRGRARRPRRRRLEPPQRARAAAAGNDGGATAPRSARAPSPWPRADTAAVTDPPGRRRLRRLARGRRRAARGRGVRARAARRADRLLRRRAAVALCGHDRGRPPAASGRHGSAKEQARDLLLGGDRQRAAGRQARDAAPPRRAGAEIAARAHGVIDLLFTGSRGYGPVRRALLGSVSGALVRDAGCPVVVMAHTAIAQDDPAPDSARAVHA